LSYASSRNGRWPPRLNGDNGKPDDTSIKDIPSPYESDPSAVADATKLATTRVGARQGIVIYGFDCPRRPLRVIIDAFEVLAGSRVRLGVRCETSLSDLVHPVHRTGEVFGWEVFGVAGKLDGQSNSSSPRLYSTSHQRRSSTRSRFPVRT
jgi:hypothetical protein